MKYSILLAIFAITMILSVSVNDCEARDVWLTHWSSENVDIYVMDDTIISGNSDSGRYFKVSTKKVRNGKLVNVINWSYSQYKSDMWRYETSTMDGNHTTVVMSRDMLFEFCMQKLNWSYHIEEPYYY